jgi:hypothetical protein
VRRRQREPARANVSRQKTAGRVRPGHSEGSTGSSNRDSVEVREDAIRIRLDTWATRDKTAIQISATGENL